MNSPVTQDTVMSSFRRKQNGLNGPVTPMNTLIYGSFESRQPRHIRRRSYREVAGIESGRDEITDNTEDDELAEKPVEKPAEKPGEIFLSSTKMLFGDAADRHILRHTSHANRGQKRRFHASIIEEDELADGEDDKNDKPRCRPGKRLLTQSAVAVADSPSVSPIEAISRKVQTSSSDVPAQRVSFRVAAAVCQKHYLYPSSPPTGEEVKEVCNLLPVIPDNELRVFRADGGQAEKYYPWLKITNKINSLDYGSDCEMIKIRQPADDSRKIGPLLILKFDTAKVASAVVSWVKNASGFDHVKFQEVESAKLVQTYERTMDEINRAIAQNPDTAPIVGGLDQQSQAPKENRSSKFCQSGLPKHPAASVLPAASALPAQPRDRIPRKDQMQLSRQDPDARPSTAPSSQPYFAPLGPSPAVSSGQASVTSSGQASPEPRTLRTRSTYTEINDVDDEPLRWSETNPDWSKDWRTPLSFNRTVVEMDDVPRLDEGQYLNDNLIGFGLRYLYDNIGLRNQDLSKRVFMHNSFFFTKLKPGRGRQINYDGVKSWTSKVDLFTYDYIVVPVNENFHWWLAIIYNPRKLDPDFCDALDGASSPGLELTDDVKDKSPSVSHEVATVGLSQLSIAEQNEAGNGDLGSGRQPADTMDVDIADSPETSEETPSDDTREATQRREQPPRPPPTNSSSGDFRIITLDSLGRAHPAAITALKSYLVQELKDKKKKEARELQMQCGMKAVNIPQQDNLCDCGVYLLGYMQVFLANPDVFVQALLRKEKPDWTVDANDVRENWRNVVLVQQKEHQEAMEQGKAKNKRVKLNSGTKTIDIPETKPTAASSPVAKLDRASENPIKRPSTPLKETTNFGPTKTSPSFVERAKHTFERQAPGVAAKVDKEPVLPTIRTSPPVRSLNEELDRRKTSTFPVENVKSSPTSPTSPIGSPMKGATPVKGLKAAVVISPTDNILEVTRSEFYKNSNCFPPPSPKTSPRRISPPKPTSIRTPLTSSSPQKMVPISSPRIMVDWGHLQASSSTSEMGREHMFGSSLMDSSFPQVMSATTLRHRRSEPAIDLTEEEFYVEGPGVI